MISFFSIIALGFFLGIRHATDPDHVIAVTTIVARYLFQGIWLRYVADVD
jgi:high-affinity nickel permease